MTQRWTRVSKRMLFTWCLLGGLIFMFAPSSLTSKLQLAYTYVRWPLVAGRGPSLASGIVSPLQAVRNTGTEKAATERQRLMNHISNLEAQLKEAHQEIDQLSSVRAVPQWERMTFLRADVTLLSQNQDVLFINRGKKDGIAAGQYVMGDLSIIGIVSNVWTRTAKIRLMTDQNSQIPVTIGELDRVMKGSPGNVAKVQLVPASYTVTKGTKVYARKTPGLLDVPIVAAEVKESRIDPEDPSVLKITVQPVCEIPALTSVVVIMSAPQQ
jgi:cell shape-determining protein MreC